jgi:fumarate reductase flavoprotein subunit
MKNSYKFLGSFVAAALCGAILIAVGCQSSAAPGEPDLRLQPGVYTGEAKGFGGVLQVQVEVTENTITRVAVGANTETDTVGTLAFAPLEKSIVENQSLADTVSGATFSSMAVKAAVEDALKKAGAQDDMLRRLRSAPIPAGPAPRDTETDIVVVGAGEAGMLAAMSAHDAGARVILLEKTSIPGGSTSLSYGAIWFLEMDDQLGQRPIKYTAQDIYQHITEYAGPMYNRPVFDAIIGGIKEYGTYLLANDFQVEPYTIPNAPVARPGWHCYVAKENGHGLTKQLYAIIQRRGIDLRFRSPAVDLLLDNGTVAGVTVQTRVGTYNIRAKKVILATGGFTWNREMLEQYAPGANIDHTQNASGIGTTGDGHRMGMAVGGVLLGEGILGLTGISTLPAFSGGNLPTPFLVNSRGEHFVRNDEYYVIHEQEIAKHPDGKAYIILDSANLSADQLATLDELIAEGHAFKADTLEGLARSLNIDAVQLAATVTANNAAYDQGQPDAMGTPHTVLRLIKQAPFYGFRRSALNMGTIAGLKVNTKMQVVNANDLAIPNLYAVGELIFGNYFNQRYPMSGTANTTAMSSGRIAGLDAAASIK